MERKIGGNVGGEGRRQLIKREVEKVRKMVAVEKLEIQKYKKTDEKKE